MSTTESNLEKGLNDLATVFDDAYEEILVPADRAMIEASAAQLSILLVDWEANQGVRFAPGGYEKWRDWFDLEIRPKLRSAGQRGEEILETVTNLSGRPTKDQVVALAIALAVLGGLENPQPSHMIVIAASLFVNRNQ